ncbi:MAG: LON peptidase substrate-binding domain-containing protein, partial [Clostridia bacterium]|nr:LON peptidase substrate-binding domain-containing protein [Clostridia bacterium]
MENYQEKQIVRTNILPTVPLRGKVAFPHTSLSFEVGRSMTLKAVERAGATADKLLFISTQIVTEKDEITEDDIYRVGCVARVKQMAHLPGGALRVTVECLYRAEARVIR